MTERGRDPVAGRLLDGRYLVAERIAVGGMATVYLARDTRLDRPVAVKLLHASWASDPTALARFVREAQSAARLSHPDVVAVHDQGQDGGEPFLVMEYVAGGTLRDVVHGHGRLSPGEAVAVMDHVLAALAAAHRLGMVHRDIKPENVLVTPDGRVKVADFGLARAVADASITTTASGLIGTAAYLAPEQWTGRPADARTDVYAAGVMLFELLTGAPPYSGEAPHVMRRHLEEEIPPPSTRAPGVPPELDRIVGWATRREPDERPRDAAALHAALLDAASRLGLTLVVPDLPAEAAASDPPAWPATAVAAAAPTVRPTAAYAPPDRTAGAPAVRTRRRRRWPLAVLAVVVLAAAAGVLGWWFAVGRYVDAPDVHGLTRAKAVAELQQHGLSASFDPRVFSTSVSAGEVAEESPDRGQRVLRHGTVRLALSKGSPTRTVPSVEGQGRKQARTLLERDGLVVSAVHQVSSTDVRAHLAVGTDPPASSTVDVGSSVTLEISSGPPAVTVPDVTDKPYDDALAAITGAGLQVHGTQVYDDTVPAGQVVSTSPAAGASAPQSSTVVVRVSRGAQQFTVPSVVDEPIERAIARIRRAGFDPDPRAGPAGGPGLVLRQSPAGGTTATHGTRVELDYY